MGWRIIKKKCGDEKKKKKKKKKDDWYDLVAKTMISKVELLDTTFISLKIRLALWPISFTVNW